MELDRRQLHFGMAAIEKGYVTANQVLRILDEQIREEESSGSHRWIGTLLLEHGFITQTQLDEILDITHSAQLLK